MPAVFNEAGENNVIGNLMKINTTSNFERLRK